MAYCLFLSVFLADCSVLSKCPHLALTSLSARFFISSVSYQWFFKNDIFIDTLSYEMPMFLNDLVHIGIGWIKSENERNSQIFRFSVFLIKKGSLSCGLSSLVFGSFYIRFWISLSDIISHSRHLHAFQNQLICGSFFLFLRILQKVHLFYSGRGGLRYSVDNSGYLCLWYIDL